MSQSLSQIVPHVPSTKTSTLPALSFSVPTKWTVSSKRNVHKKIFHDREMFDFATQRFLNTAYMLPIRLTSKVHKISYLVIRILHRHLRNDHSWIVGLLYSWILTFLAHCSLHHPNGSVHYPYQNEKIRRRIWQTEIHFLCKARWRHLYPSNRHIWSPIHHW